LVEINITKGVRIRAYVLSIVVHLIRIENWIFVDLVRRFLVIWVKRVMVNIKSVGMGASEVIWKIELSIWLLVITAILIRINRRFVALLRWSIGCIYVILRMNLRITCFILGNRAKLLLVW